MSKLMAKMILISLLLVCGCAHLKCGPCEYWRLGKQEIAYLRVVLDPNCPEFELRGHKGGENVKPSVEGVLFE